MFSRTQMTTAGLFAVMMAGAVVAQVSPLAPPPAAGPLIGSDATAPANPDPAHPGEEAVDPYAISNANAGASPIADPKVFAAFHGKDGISRIIDELFDTAKVDPRTQEVFHAADFVRLKRTMKEQVCYILGGGCDYTGRSMEMSHKDHGVTVAEMGATVEILQTAMDHEGVPFAAQNKLLAKLAPMKRSVVTR